MERWYFKARECNDGIDPYIAWCAQTPNLGNSPLDLVLDGFAVHAAFGKTPEEAISKLHREVLN